MFRNILISVVILFAVCLALVDGQRTCTLSGTVVPTIAQTSVVAGGGNLIMTLSGDTFVATLTDTMKTRLIQFITSDQTSLTTGWKLWQQAQIATGLNQVILNTSTQVTISFVPVPGYVVTVPEIISVTVPPDSLSSGSVLAASQKFTVLQTLTVTIGGTFQTSATQRTVISGGKNIQITLTSNSFLPLTTANKMAILAALKTTATPVPANGWNNVWIPAQQTDLTQVYLNADGSVCTILMIAAPNFSITSPELVTITVPGSVTLYNRDVTATVPLTVKQTVTATLTGSFLDPNIAVSQLDKAIIAGGQSIVINLKNDVYNAVLSDSDKSAIIDGMVSSSQQLHGWNLDYVPKLKANLASITRASDVAVTIQMPADATYQISQPETVTVTIPAAVIATQQVVVATPLITVKTPTASVSGTFMASLVEQSVINGGLTIVIQLYNDSWQTTLTGTIRTAIITGMQASSSPAGGWNLVWIPAATKSTALERMVVTSSSGNLNDILTFTMPVVGTYSIINFESISVVVPASALTVSPVALTASPSLKILNNRGYAGLSGTFIFATGGRIESTVISGGRTILVSLVHDTFQTLTDDLKTALINGFTTTSTVSLGWNAWVTAMNANGKAGITVSSDMSTITISMIAVPNYLLASAETVTLTIPASLVSSNQAITAVPKLIIYPGGTTGSNPSSSKSVNAAMVVRIDITTIASGTVARGVFVGGVEQDLDASFYASRPDKGATAQVSQLQAGPTAATTLVYFTVQVAGDALASDVVTKLNSDILSGSMTSVGNQLIVTSYGVALVSSSAAIFGPSIIITIFISIGMILAY